LAAARDPVTGDETAPSAPQVERFAFVTEDADAALARRLRARSRDFTAAGDDWTSRLTPVDGEASVLHRASTAHRLPRRTLRRILYARFGRRVVLRIVDERGRDLFDRLEYLATHATELPEYQAAGVGSSPAAARRMPRRYGTWASRASTTVLETNQRYEASLVPIPTPVEPFDPSTIDWNAFHAVHTFRFRTSRWPNLDAHLVAHAVLDEVAATPDGAPRSRRIVRRPRRSRRGTPPRRSGARGRARHPRPSAASERRGARGRRIWRETEKWPGAHRTAR
jgi:hypothetical protein